MMVLFNVRANLLKIGTCCCVARCRNAAEHWCSLTSSCRPQLHKDIWAPIPIQKNTAKENQPQTMLG